MAGRARGQPGTDFVAQVAGEGPRAKAGRQTLFPGRRFNPPCRRSTRKPPASETTGRMPRTGPLTKKAVLKMHERLGLYVRLKNTLKPEGAQNWPQETGRLRKDDPGWRRCGASRTSRSKIRLSVAEGFRRVLCNNSIS